MSAAPNDQARAVLRAVRRALNDPLLATDRDGTDMVTVRDMHAVLRGLAAQYGVTDLDDEQ